MRAFEVGELNLERERRKEAYQEFLRTPSMSCGLYVLPAGGEDPQVPHTEDEVYYIVSGRGTIRVGPKDRPVRSGSVVFVRAGAKHRFHPIEEDLTVLVVFAPAEGTADKR